MPWKEGTLFKVYLVDGCDVRERGNENEREREFNGCSILPSPHSLPPAFVRSFRHVTAAAAEAASGIGRSVR